MTSWTRERVIYELKATKGEPLHLYQLKMYWDGLVLDGVQPTEAVPIVPKYTSDLARMTELNTGILLALYTGCHLGEICALRWRDVDRSRKELHLRQTVKRLPRKQRQPGQSATELVFSPTKGRDGSRRIAAPAVVFALLEMQCCRHETQFGTSVQPEGFVVYNTQDQLTDPDNPSHYFGEVLTALQLPHARFHDLRHIFATRAIEHGMDILTLSGMLGHADVGTTQTFYLHPRLEAMHRQMDCITPACGWFRAAPAGL